MTLRENNTQIMDQISQITQIFANMRDQNNTNGPTTRDNDDNPPNNNNRYYRNNCFNYNRQSNATRTQTRNNTGWKYCWSCGCQQTH